MQILRMPQNSEEWYQARLGRVTASCFSDVMAGGKGITRNKYMLRLAAERLTGMRQDSYSNAAMEAGHEFEPLARAAYEFEHDVAVEQIGLVQSGEWIAASPDGLVGDNGLLELKCPYTTTHMQYWLDDRLPPEYRQQVQGQLWVSEREFCDFCSYDGRLKTKNLFVHRVMRDEKFIVEIKSAVNQFVEELQELIHTFSGE